MNENYEDLKNELKELGKNQFPRSEQFKKDVLDILKEYSHNENLELQMYGTDVYSFEIGKFSDCKENWSIDFSIRHWYKDEPISLNLNFGVSGSFGVNDKKQLEKYTFLGIICQNFKEIEDKILSLTSFKDYHRDYDKISEISYKVKSIEYDIKKKEIENKKDFFISKIKVGSIIDTRPNDSIQEDDGWYAKKINDLKNQEIVWMSKKNISFKRDYGKRTKMDNLLKNLIDGIWILKDKKDKILDNKEKI